MARIRDAFNAPYDDREWPEDYLALDIDDLNGVNHIQSASDLPPAENGTHSLADNTVYRFDEFVSSNAGLELGDMTILTAEHGGSGGFIHTGGSAAIQAVDVPIFMRDIGISAPGGTVFDVAATDSTEVLIESASFADFAGIAPINSLGTIDGYRVPSFKGCNFEDFADGLTFTGGMDKIFISESPFREPAGSGVQCITLASGLDVDIIDIAGSYGKGFNADTEFVHTNAGGEPDDVLQLRGTTFDSSVSKANILTGTLDEGSVGVSVRACWPLADSRPGVSYSATSSTTVTITTQDPGDGSEAVKIDAPTEVFPPVTDRFTHTSPNRATYIGRRDFVDTLTASVSVSGSNTTVALYVVKNGTVLDRAKVDVTTASAGQPRAVSLSARLMLQTDDYVELWLANEGGTGDITVSTLDVTI